MVTPDGRRWAGPTVGTGVAAALVPPLLAVGAREAGRTDAAVAAGGLLQARAPVEARPVCARHGADLAVLPVEALRTGAGVVVHLILGGRGGGQSGERRQPCAAAAAAAGHSLCSCRRSCRGCCRIRWSRSRSSCRRSRAGRRTCSCPRRCWCTRPRSDTACDWCNSSGLKFRNTRREQR